MFWDELNKYRDNIAVIDTNTDLSITYNNLHERSNILLKELKTEKKKLSFLFCKNNYSSILAYVTLLRSGYTQLLLDNDINPELRNELLKIYQPEILITHTCDEIQNYKIQGEFDGLNIYKCVQVNYSEIYSDLAVLLSTSGTTGSPKLVRLSYENIQSNAESIGQYLNITEEERPITSLPMSYSYGLSVINSHLLNGAAIILTTQTIVLRDFWNIFQSNNCTSFAGVPYSFQLLKKIHFNKLNLPSLKTITQAGGRLSEEYIQYFYDLAIEKNYKFYVMYGQTEATARISYLPFEMLKEKIGSVGIPIPNGKIKIMNDEAEILIPKTVGELVYYGSNVMLGYAESRNCLKKGDELDGVLHTNDVGFKDKDGYIYITGRKKRFIKIYGLRINLDEVEKMVENNFQCPAVCMGNDDSLIILLQIEQDGIEKIVARKLIQMYKLPPSVFKIKRVKRILTTLQGKKDYQKMGELKFSNN